MACRKTRQAMILQSIVCRLESEARSELYDSRFARGYELAERGVVEIEVHACQVRGSIRSGTELCMVECVEGFEPQFQRGRFAPQPRPLLQVEVPVVYPVFDSHLIWTRRPPAESRRKVAYNRRHECVSVECLFIILARIEIPERCAEVCEAQHPAASAYSIGGVADRDESARLEGCDSAYAPSSKQPAEHAIEVLTERKFVDVTCHEPVRNVLS